MLFFFRFLLHLFLHWVNKFFLHPYQQKHLYYYIIALQKMAIQYTVAFKFWFFFSIAFQIINQMFFCQNVMDDYEWLYERYCFSILYDGISSFLFNFLLQESLIFGTISIVCSFWIMAEAFTQREKKSSTLNMIFDVFFQNLLITILAIFFQLIIESSRQRSDLDDSQPIFPSGWHSLMLLYYWKNARQNPQSLSIFFSLKKKYFKWILMILTIGLTFHLFSLLAAAIIATLQETLCKKCACKPCKILLSKMQKVLCCSCITQRDDFIKTEERKSDEKKQLELAEEKKIDSETVFEKGMGIKVQETSQSKEDMEITWKQKK